MPSKHERTASWKIGPAEFGSLESADVRFREALQRGWLHDHHRLPFLTTWVYIRRRTEAGRIKNPGAVLTACVRSRTWRGSNEVEAIEYIRQSKPEREYLPEVLSLAERMKARL